MVSWELPTAFFVTVVSSCSARVCELVVEVDTENPDSNPDTNPDPNPNPDTNPNPSCVSCAGGRGSYSSVKTHWCKSKSNDSPYHQLLRVRVRVGLGPGLVSGLESEFPVSTTTSSTHTRWLTVSPTPPHPWSALARPSSLSWWRTYPPAVRASQCAACLRPRLVWRTRSPNTWAAEAMLVIILVIAAGILTIIDDNNSCTVSKKITLSKQR